ncbi:MAG TPA: hypothetical protein VGH80_05465 [Xanthomonadaceae bacterium]|jgi:hypothetical protein
MRIGGPPAVEASLAPEFAIAIRRRMGRARRDRVDAVRFYLSLHADEGIDKFGSMPQHRPCNPIETG